MVTKGIPTPWSGSWSLNYMTPAVHRNARTERELTPILEKHRASPCFHMHYEKTRFCKSLMSLTMLPWWPAPWVKQKVGLPVCTLWPPSLLLPFASSVLVCVVGRPTTKNTNSRRLASNTSSSFRKNAWDAVAITGLECVCVCRLILSLINGCGWCDSGQVTGNPSTLENLQRNGPATKRS